MGFDCHFCRLVDCIKTRIVDSEKQPVFNSISIETILRDTLIIIIIRKKGAWLNLKYAHMYIHTDTMLQLAA